MSTEIVVPSEQTAVMPFVPPDLSGLTDVARLRPTALNLVQPSTRDGKGAMPGQFLDVLLGEALNNVEVVPLRILRTRVYFPSIESSGLDSSPICRSMDGIRPSEFAQVKQASTCARCSKSQWVKVDGKNKKPPCQEKLRLLVIRVDNKMPRWITFSGSSFVPMREVFERILQDITINRTNGTILTLHDYKLNITSVKKPSPKGSFFVASAEVGRIQDIGEYGPFFKEFVESQQYPVEEGPEDSEIVSDVKIDNAVTEVIDAEIVTEV